MDINKIKNHRNVEMGSYKISQSDINRAIALSDDIIIPPQSAKSKMLNDDIFLYEIYINLIQMLKYADKNGNLNIKHFHIKKLLDDKTIQFTDEFLISKDTNDMFDNKTQDIIDDSLKNLMRTYIPIYMDMHKIDRKMPLIKKVGVYDIKINKDILNKY